MRAHGLFVPLLAIAAATFLAGCEQPTTPTRAAEDSAVLIPVGPGLRCHQGQCLEFHPTWQEARIRPFDYVPLPRGTRVGGVLTEAQFRDLYEQARKAPLGGYGPGGG
jgi:hypothetical protein